MAVTANFGWVTPDDTSYVKAGAAAIRTLADAMDSALAASVGGLRNRLINGDFGVWQRGTTGTTGYVADRWTLTSNQTSPAQSRQTLTVGTLPDRAIYMHRYAGTTTGGTSEQAYLEQRVESVATFAGREVTVSLAAKADATRSIAIRLVQVFGTGGSAAVVVAPTKLTLSTSMTGYSATFTLPSITGKTIGTGDYLAVQVWYSCGATTNATLNGLIGTQSGTFDITTVQLERGGYATPFEFRPQQVESAMCQRYYYRLASGDNLGCTGRSASTTQHYFGRPHPVPMRSAPAVTFNSPTSMTVFSQALSTTVSTMTNNTSTATALALNVTTGAIGSAGSAIDLQITSPGYIEVSAEL